MAIPAPRIATPKFGFQQLLSALRLEKQENTSDFHPTVTIILHMMGFFAHHKLGTKYDHMSTIFQYRLLGKTVFVEFDKLIEQLDFHFEEDELTNESEIDIFHFIYNAVIAIDWLARQGLADSAYMYRALGWMLLDFTATNKEGIYGHLFREDSPAYKALDACVEGTDEREADVLEHAKDVLLSVTMFMYLRNSISMSIVDVASSAIRTALRRQDKEPVFQSDTFKTTYAVVGGDVVINNAAGVVSLAVEMMKYCPLNDRGEMVTSSEHFARRRHCDRMADLVNML
jgi:hypothetical protein